MAKMRANVVRGVGDYRVVRSGRGDLTQLLTPTFSLSEIGEACDLFGSRRDGVLEVAIRP